MDQEFPGVIDLNVSGTHYRTLLSTLTKDEDSVLAAMFTGRLPVHKDKGGRFFIEANGFTFKAILNFLLYDELSFHETGKAVDNFRFGRTAGSGFGGGFGAGTRHRELFGDLSDQYTSRQIELLYRDSQNLGLKRLNQTLEQFQPNSINVKMDKYRKSVRGYDDTIAAIIDIIPAESLFHRTVFSLRIKKDLQTIDEKKCCEHECKTLPLASFQQPYFASVDAIVEVPFEVNSTVLSALTIDLQKRRYMVQGQVTFCGFECKKEVKQSKYVVFASQRRHCCVDDLFLLNFKWDTEADVVTNPGLFGMKQGGAFGTPQNTRVSFGAAPQKQTGSGLFGGGQQDNFGQSPSFGFGTAQQSGTNAQGSGFGSGFGSGQPQAPFEKGSSFGFGGGEQGSGFDAWQQPGPFAQGNNFGTGAGQQQQPLFGQQSFESSQVQKQQGPNVFGPPAFSFQQCAPSVTSNQRIFGGNQSTFGGKQSQNIQQKGSAGVFSFNSPQRQQTLLFAGKSPTPGIQQGGQSLFGSSSNKAQHVFGGKPSFESKIGALNLQQTTITVKPDQSSGLVSSANNKGEVLFGKPAAMAGVFKTEGSTKSSSHDKEEL